jgi:hypothetical protein
VAAPADLAITDAGVQHLPGFNLLVFEQTVAGTAGGTLPEAQGALDGAPVIAYVFPTTLQPGDVGFGETEGIVGLVATSHPDFDDTPLWDENANGDYADDGSLYHTHWVLLAQDERAPAGLVVKQFKEGDPGIVIPPTNPGLTLYLDSPGFPVRLSGNQLQVLVPDERAGGQTAFSFDAVTASLMVNTSDPNQPLLGVQEVHSVLSSDLSLPFEVQESE